MPNTTKQCVSCKEKKDVSLFYFDKRRTDGLTSYCKKCHYEKVKVTATKNKGWNTETQRNSRLKRVFGISLNEYNTLLEEQNFKCAICNKTEEQNGKRLAVDHCHTTNKVRKLLCHHCNCALGMVNDSEEILISMLSYLKEFR